MSTKTGQLRETLIRAIDDVMSGKIKAPEALAIAKLGTAAASILQAEINAVKELRALGIKIPYAQIGEVTIGAIIEGEVAKIEPAALPAPQKQDFGVSVMPKPPREPGEGLQRMVDEDQKRVHVHKGSRY